MTQSPTAADRTEAMHPVEPDRELAPVIGQSGDHAPSKPEHSDTRERILDVALELFTEQGYDGTSLREIAERLGVTKAALYYHFESKEDILLALHMRIHEFGKDALSRMELEPVTLELWGEMLEAVVDQVLAQRQIFLMHQRNEAAIEKLHDRTHEAEHEDLQNRLRLVLSDPSLPLRDRVRMAAAVGVVFSGVVLAGDTFTESYDGELGALLREVLHDVLSAS